MEEEVKKIICPICKKGLEEKNFYSYKNGEKCNICKDCLTKDINIQDEKSFLWLLKYFDIPYIPYYWQQQIELEQTHNKIAVCNETIEAKRVFGQYYSKMKLRGYRDFSWSDSGEFIQGTYNKEANYPQSSLGGVLINGYFSR